VRLLENGHPCVKNVELIDLNALPMIETMCENGLRVDLTHFERMGVELVRDMEAITEKVRQQTGYYANLNSGDQVADLLFKKLGIKQARAKMTRGGSNKESRESVEDAVLTAIQHEHECVVHIQDFKELSKLLSTYIKPMPKLASHVGHDNWRMYPNLSYTRVPSGRLACKEPNLLAMPNRTERGRQVCEGFICDPGYVYLSADLSQIEPRIATHRSQDPNLLHIYRNHEDIYSAFATMAFRLKDERYFDRNKGEWVYPTVDRKAHRFPAKTCILASIYSVTAKGLLEQMPVVCANCLKEATKHDCSRFKALWTEEKCQEIITAFYQEYKFLLKMQKADHQFAMKYGYIGDMWGRIWHSAAVYSVHDYVVAEALRVVTNHPIQASAAGVIKLVMAATFDDLTDAGMLDLCRPVLQIHDELLFECREDMAEELGSMVTWRMQTAVKLSISIEAGTATASSWGLISK